MQLDGEPWAQTIPVNAAQPLLVRPAQQAYGLFALASAAERVGAGRALLAGHRRSPLSAACRCARLCTLVHARHACAPGSAECRYLNTQAPAEVLDLFVHVLRRRLCKARTMRGAQLHVAHAGTSRMLTNAAPLSGIAPRITSLAARERVVSAAMLEALKAGKAPPPPPPLSARASAAAAGAHFGATPAGTPGGALPRAGGSGAGPAFFGAAANGDARDGGAADGAAVGLEAASAISDSPEVAYSYLGPAFSAEAPIELPVRSGLAGTSGYAAPANTCIEPSPSQHAGVHPCCCAAHRPGCIARGVTCARAHRGERAPGIVVEPDHTLSQVAWPLVSADRDPIHRCARATQVVERVPGTAPVLDDSPSSRPASARALARPGSGQRPGSARRSGLLRRSPATPERGAGAGADAAPAAATPPGRHVSFDGVENLMQTPPPPPRR